MKKYLLLPLVLILVTSLMFLGSAQPAPAPSPAQAPKPAPAPAKVIELKFGHHSTPTGGLIDKWPNAWAKELEKASNGRIKVTIYSSRSLAGEREMLAAVEAGLADIAWIPTGMYPGRFPLTNAIGLPFISLPSGKVNGKVYGSAKINGRILWEIYEQMPEMQKEWSTVKMLYTLIIGPNFPASKRPIRNANDIKGMKIRTLAGGPTEMLTALGASPLSLQLPEIYESLQKGVIDGVLTNYSQIVAFKLQEVLKYYTTVFPIVDPQGCVMNRKKFDSLSPDLQKAVMSVSGLFGAEWAGDASGDYLEGIFAKVIKKPGNEMTKVDLDPGELDKWQQTAGKPIWDKWVAQMSAKGVAAKTFMDELAPLKEKYK